jgi:hypothetical protein
MKGKDSTSFTKQSGSREAEELDALNARLRRKATGTGRLMEATMEKESRRKRREEAEAAAKSKRGLS